MSIPASLVATIRNALSPPDVQPLEPPVLLDAATVLELAGESLRPRLIFATGPDGRELCLRPDLTVPAALSLLDMDAEDGPVGRPVAFLCDGLVFRAPQNGENRAPEFRQIGLERFDDADAITADIDMLHRSLTAVRDSGVANAVIRLGDASLMPTLLEALNPPTPWRERLLTAAHSPALLRRRIAEAATPARPAPPLGAALLQVDFAQAEAAVGEMLALSGTPIIGGRDAAVIAARLRDQAARASAKPLSAPIAEGLLELLAVADTPRVALDHVAEIANRLGADLSAFLAAWNARLAALTDTLLEARFEAGFTGTFDYYDGLLFEITHPKLPSKPLAAGGRYNTLISRLSRGSRQANGIGCVVRPDRVAIARGLA